MEHLSFRFYSNRNLSDNWLMEKSGPLKYDPQLHFMPFLFPCFLGNLAFLLFLNMICAFSFLKCCWCGFLYLLWFVILILPTHGYIHQSLGQILLPLWSVSQHANQSICLPIYLSIYLSSVFLSPLPSFFLSLPLNFIFKALFTTLKYSHQTKTIIKKILFL